MASENPNPGNPRDGQPKRSGGDKRPKLSLGTFYLFVLVALLLLAAQTLFASGSGAPEVDYSTFLGQVEAGDVESFEVQDRVEIRGVYTEEAVEADRVEVSPAEPSFGRPPSAEAGREFRSTKPDDHDLTDFVQTVNEGLAAADREPVEFTADYTSSVWSGLISWILLFGLLAVFWIFILRRMGGARPAGPQHRQKQGDPL